MWVMILDSQDKTYFYTKLMSEKVHSRLLQICRYTQFFRIA